MPLPVTFAALTSAVMADLDENFSALGALTPIPCTVAGTNSLTFTPATNTPTIAAYQNYMPFSGIAANSNTGATTAAIGGLAALSIYKDTASGPAVLAGGEIVAGNVIYLLYDSALASGVGGFHLSNVPVSGYVTISGSPSAGQIGQWASGTALTVPLPRLTQ